MADQYTIDIEKYIPPNLRPFAQGLGLNDLSNLNPVTSLFMRPRDAAARYAEPEKYSPTGQRETMDLVEAGMGPLEALLGVGIGRYLTQPAKQVLTSTFTGVDPDVPQADAALPVGIETLVPPPENLAINEVFDMPSSAELDFLRSMSNQVEEGQRPFAPSSAEPYVPNFDDQFIDRVDEIDIEDPELFGAARDYDDYREELGGEGDGLIDLGGGVFVEEGMEPLIMPRDPVTGEIILGPGYREYGINFDEANAAPGETQTNVGIDIERGLIFGFGDGPQSIFERANFDDFVQRFGTAMPAMERDGMMASLMEGSLDLLDTYMEPEDANRVRLGILSDIGMPANDLDYVDNFMADVQAADPGMMFDSAKSYQYGLMDDTTPFKSKYAEVVQGLNQTKFGSAADFLNFLRNRDVTEAELQARNLTEESLPPGKFDAESLIGKQGIGGGQPLKATVHTGPNTAYAQHFTPGGRNYSETVITLDNPKIGLTSVASDPLHFSTTQSDAGGPSVVHVRSALFDVVDRRFGTIGEPNPDGLGKAFHVGEIQSQATQNARGFRKARNRIDDEFGGPQKLSDFAYVEAMPVDRFGRGKTLLDAVTEYKDTEVVANNLKNDPNYDPRYTGVSLEDHERHLVNLQADIEKVLESGNYGFKTFDDVLEYQNKVQNLLREEQGIFARDQSRSQINELLSQIYGPNTVDDIGIGSLYTTERTTTIALKHALDQAITLEDADFLTIGTGDMAYSMTGGTLEGQQEYYDEILPKTFNNLLARLEKENKVKLPRLKTQTIQGTDGEPHVVRGIELTDELKEIFRNPDKGVYAFKTGGQVKLRSGVMSAPGNGMVR